MLLQTAGLLLLATQLLPIYLLLDEPSTGPAGVATVALGRAIGPLLLWGSLVMAGLAAVLAITPLTARVGTRARHLGQAMLRPSPLAWSIALGLTSFTLAALASLFVFERLPTLLDEMTQLLHARYFASGALAGQLPSPVATRLLQNDLITPTGWVSVYPPLHTLLLAAGFLVSAPWLVGPLLLGVTITFTALTADRLLPENPVAARLGSLLAALSPFLIFLGSGYLSHTSAAAFATVSAYAAVRARDGSAKWAALAGAAASAMVASRPWTGLVLGGFFTFGVWGAALRSRDVGWLFRRLALAALGALPFALGLAWYNTHLFGSPVRFGYDVAFGPSHGLGWHADPWSNAYGALQALAYSAFDLLALGQHLLETPVPALALVAVWLIVARSSPRGTGVLLGWALLPVAANAVYWHHGYHLGPRMLYEAAPAWAMLTALAVTELAGGRLGVVAVEGEPEKPSLTVSALALWVCVLSIPAGIAFELVPRIASYRWDASSLALSRPPQAPGGRPALVFVHGSWQGRVSAELVSLGMRRDSVETLMRRNDACVAQLYLEVRRTGEVSAAGRAAGGGAGGRAADGGAGGDSVGAAAAGAAGAAAAADIMPAMSPPVTFTPLPGTPSSLELLTVAPGMVVRKDPAFEWVQLCRREAEADRLGVVELAPLLWQTPLPEDDGALILVRDLGPYLDQTLLAGFPDREGFFYMSRTPDQAPELVPFEEGMRILWAGG